MSLDREPIGLSGGVRLNLYHTQRIDSAPEQEHTNR
jgi:hypothetical protein